MSMVGKMYRGQKDTVDRTTEFEDIAVNVPGNIVTCENIDDTKQAILCLYGIPMEEL